MTTKFEELEREFYLHFLYEVPEVTSEERRKALANEFVVLAFGKVV